MTNVSDESCRVNRNTPVMFENFFPEDCAVSEMMWKEAVKSDDNTEHARCVLDN